MLIETKRSVFDPIRFPLNELDAETITGGEILDFDAENQMKETNEVLEVFVSSSATAGQTVTPEVAAAEKEVTLEVTAAPTGAGDVTIAGVTLGLTLEAHTDLATTAAAIAAVDYSSVGWTAVQGTGADTAKVYFTASVAGVKDDLVYSAGTTGATASVTTTAEGTALIPEVIRPHAPTLQLILKHGNSADSLTTLQTGKTFTLAELTAGEVLYKAALPDNTGQFIQVNLNVASEDTFTGGEVVGMIRPL